MCNNNKRKQNRVQYNINNKINIKQQNVRKNNNSDSRGYKEIYQQNVRKNNALIPLYIIIK